MQRMVLEWSDLGAWCEGCGGGYDQAMMYDKVVLYCDSVGNNWCPACANYSDEEGAPSDEQYDVDSDFMAQHER